MKDLSASYKKAFCYGNADLLDGIRQPIGDTLKHIGEFPELLFDIKSEDEHNAKKGIYQKERRMSPIQSDARDEFLVDMKEVGGIERAPSCAKYAMPFVVAAKQALVGTWT